MRVDRRSHHIVRAAALLRDEFPALRVVLAGAAASEYPDYPDTLARLAREMGLDGDVDMPGHVAPEEVLPQLTVFVNATYRDEEGFGLEGLSGAMLEAGWVGVPVVAVGGGAPAKACAKERRERSSIPRIRRSSPERLPRTSETGSSPAEPVRRPGPSYARPLRPRPGPSGSSAC